jgi:hypothetical protein
MKWVEVLKETIANLTNIAVLWDPATNLQVKAVEEAAGVLDLKWRFLRHRAGTILLMRSPLQLG